MNMSDQLQSSSQNEDSYTQGEDLLNQEETMRYDRQMILPEIRKEGQLKLKKSKVLLVGIGGLGSPIAMYLAAAGIGTLGIIDFDTVDISNIHRQIIHSTNDIGKSKLFSAKKSLNAINPNVKIRLHDIELKSENAIEILSEYDIICDCSDNFPTRYLVNDACVLLNKPYVFGSIFQFEGQISVFHSSKGPCYRCLYENPPDPGLVPSCAEGGVIGTLPGIVGTLQANEIIKLIIHKGEPLIGRLIVFDALTSNFKEMQLLKNKDCILCGLNPIITELIDYNEFCKIPVENNYDLESIIHPSELPNLKKEDVLIIDVREFQEVEISKIPNSLHIPLNELNSKIHLLNKNKIIVLYCKSGIRSGMALIQLQKLGFPNVRNLIGGIDEWQKLQN